MDKETRDKILLILANIENEIAEIKKCMASEHETQREVVDFDWDTALRGKFNIDLANLEEGYRVKYENVEISNSQLVNRLQKECPPKNGDPINLILRFLEAHIDYNRSKGKVCAIQTILLEHYGFKFGSLPETVTDIQKTWFKEIIEMREIYRERVIIYPQGNDFDWDKALDNRFDIDLRGIEEGYGVSVENVKNDNKRFLKKIHICEKDAPKNGTPINLVLRFMNASYNYRRSNGKVYAIRMLLLEHHGFRFGVLPTGVADTQKKWFKEIIEMIEIYRNRIIYY